jgi:hypothetical protein
MYIHLLFLGVKGDRFVIELETYFGGNAEGMGLKLFRHDLDLGKRCCRRTKLDSGVSSSNLPLQDQGRVARDTTRNPERLLPGVSVFAVNVSPRSFVAFSFGFRLR